MSTARESEPASNAHRLSTKDGRSGHDNKIKRANEGNSRPVEHKGSEKSTEKRANERRVLTLCVTVCGGKVVGTNQDDERKPARQGHSHPAKHRQRVRLGQTKEGREPGGDSQTVERRGRERSGKASD